MYFYLDDFNVFNDVKNLLSESICNIPITTGVNREKIEVLVPAAIQVPSSTELIPGYLNVQIQMAGRRSIKIKAEGDFEIYFSDTEESPSKFVYQFKQNWSLGEEKSISYV